MRRALPFAGTAYQDEFVRNDFTYGVAMFQHGYLDEAAASFQQVVAAKPNNAEGYYNLGTLSLQRHDFSQARQYLEAGIKAATELSGGLEQPWNDGCVRKVMRMKPSRIFVNRSCCAPAMPPRC